MKSIAKVLKYEGLLLTGLALLGVFLATDMFVRFWYLLLLGPVCLLAGFALDVGSIGATLRRRTTKYGINAVIFTIVVLAIVGFANIAAKGADKSWDGTNAKVNTISDQTVKILKSLKEPVHVAAFFAAAEGKDVEKLLERYKTAAPAGMFDFQMVDPDQHPELLKKYDVNRRGVIVVEQGERKNIFGEHTEQALTEAIIKVTQSKTGPVCFLSGHGEATLDNQEDNGANLFKRLLENENRDVKEIVLAGRAVPEECGELVIAGPERPLSEAEAKTVQAWVEKGGNLFLMEGANTSSGLEGWIGSLGVTFDDDVIVEPYNNPVFGSQLGVTPVVQDYPPAEITKDLNQPTIFNMARSLSIKEDVNSTAHVTPLLKTSADAWGEMNIKDLLEKQQVVKDSDDKAGPLVLGAVIELKASEPAPAADIDAPKPEKPPVAKAGRIVVIGDSTLARNSMVTQLYNRNLVLNTIAWLSGKEEMISIRPNEFPSTMVFLTNEDRAKVFAVSVLAIPMLVSMFGIGVIISRNRRSNA